MKNDKEITAEVFGAKFANETQIFGVGTSLCFENIKSLATILRYAQENETINWKHTENEESKNMVFHLITLFCDAGIQIGDKQIEKENLKAA